MGYLNSDGLETQIQYIKSYVEDEMKKHASIPIGHEYFSMNPNIPQGSLPLLGGVYSRDTYADLWAWVQQQIGYLKSEADWQALSASNNGNVPYYSVGDGSTTFRVPSLKCWIKGPGGIETVGTYIDAGLPEPNIDVVYRQDSTSSGVYTEKYGSDGYTGSAYSNTGGTDEYMQSSLDKGIYAPFGAVCTNPIYGNADTVVPESIVGLWLVKAYGAVEDTGTIDEQAYIDDRFAASKQYTDDEVNDAVTTLNSDISAINTRLGTILEASGTSTTKNAYTTLCSISTHPAGTWLIVSYMDLSYTASDTYNHGITPANHNGINTRNQSAGGGGNSAVLLTQLDENETVSTMGYQTQAGTMRGRLMMVRLA